MTYDWAINNALACAVAMRVFGGPLSVAQLLTATDTPSVCGRWPWWRPIPAHAALCFCSYSRNNSLEPQSFAILGSLQSANKLK